MDAVETEQMELANQLTTITKKLAALVAASEAAPAQPASASSMPQIATTSTQWLDPSSMEKRISIPSSFLAQQMERLCGINPSGHHIR